jgi:hypothetical protein
MRRLWTWRIAKGVAALATGAVLLQTSSCTLDEDLLNELLEVLLNSMLTTT